MIYHSRQTVCEREREMEREREIVVGKDNNTVEGYIEATDAIRFWGLRLLLFCLELFQLNAPLFRININLDTYLKLSHQIES